MVSAHATNISFLAVRSVEVGWNLPRSRGSGRQRPAQRPSQVRGEAGEQRPLSSSQVEKRASRSEHGRQPSVFTTAKNPSAFPRRLSVVFSARLFVVPASTSRPYRPFLVCVEAGRVSKCTSPIRDPTLKAEKGTSRIAGPAL